MNYIVYKTTNLINGKIYVGVHRTNPDVFDGYIGCGVNKKDKKKKVLKGFPKAVRKYGYSNFKRETLFIYPDTELGRLEAYKKESEIVNIEFIKRKDTYNLVIGGLYSSSRSRKIIQYSINGEFIRVWNSITEAKIKLNLSSILGNLRGEAKYCGNYLWKFYNGDISNIEPVLKKERTVFQFDLLGNLIKTWNSLTEASKTFDNSKAAKTAIWNVCNDKSNLAYGYYWSYKNKFIPKTNNHLAPVAKYNDSGEFIASYSSIKEAAIENNIKSPSNIINTIKGLLKRCGGFRWRYFYGNTANIKPL